MNCPTQSRPGQADSPTERFIAGLRAAYDREAEKWCLASALLDTSTQANIFAIVTADDFLDEANRDVARIIETHLRLGQPCDALTVKNAMIGDRYSHTEATIVLVLLAEDVCTTAHATHYARRVRDCALRRKVQAACLDAIAAAISGHQTADTIANDLSAEIYSLSRDAERREATAILPRRRVRH